MGLVVDATGEGKVGIGGRRLRPLPTSTACARGLAGLPDLGRCYIWPVSHAKLVASISFSSATFWGLPWHGMGRLEWAMDVRTAAGRSTRETTHNMRPWRGRDTRQDSLRPRLHNSPKGWPLDPASEASPPPRPLSRPGREWQLYCWLCLCVLDPPPSGLRRPPPSARDNTLTFPSLEVAAASSAQGLPLHTAEARPTFGVPLEELPVCFSLSSSQVRRSQTKQPLHQDNTFGRSTWPPTRPSSSRSSGG